MVVRGVAFLLFPSLLKKKKVPELFGSPLILVNRFVFDTLKEFAVMKVSFFFAGALLGVVSLVAAQSNSSCLCLPDDDCWPGQGDWQSLNETVNGQLVEVVPIGAVCHDPHYDAVECQKLRDNWDDVSIQ